MSSTLTQFDDFSSNHKSNLLLTYATIAVLLSFEVYMLVIVTSTDSVQLLIPNSKVVKFPNLGIDISLFGFYIVAPLFLVAMHLHLLFNQYLLIKNKLEELNSNPTNNLIYLPCNIKTKSVHTMTENEFVEARHFLSLHTPSDNEYHNNKRPFWLQSIYLFIYIFTYIVPSSILLLTQLTFSKYHSFWMTLWHFIIFIFNFFCLKSYWNQTISQNKIKISSEQIKHGQKIEQYGKIFFFIIQNLERVKNIFKWANPGWQSFFFNTMLCMSFFNFLLILFLWLNIFYKFEIFQFIYPRIVVEGEILGKEGPSDDDVLLWYFKQKSNLSTPKGLNLQNRDLRFADLSGSKLFNADLRNTLFEYAKLDKCFLDGVVASKASFRGASLEQANIRNAYLDYTNFNEANLNNAKLSGSNFSHAEFNKTILNRSVMDGSILKFTTFNHAELKNAQIQGADLEGSNIIDSNLSAADFRGTFLRDTELVGSDLDLRTIKLSGGVLYNTIFNEYSIDPISLNETIGTIKSPKKYTPKKMNYNDFKNIRNELVCKDKYIALGIIRQYQPNKYGVPSKLIDLYNDIFSLGHSENDILDDIKSNINENCNNFLQYFNFD